MLISCCHLCLLEYKKIDGMLIVGFRTVMALHTEACAVVKTDAAFLTND